MFSSLLIQLIDTELIDTEPIDTEKIPVWYRVIKSQSTILVQSQNWKIEELWKKSKNQEATHLK